MSGRPTEATQVEGLYDPSSGRDACGTGFIARLDGVRTHRLVEQAVEGVVNLTHRGAVNADPDTGDGAGILIEIPYALLADELRRLGRPELAEDALALAMVFLPHDASGHERAREAIAEAVTASGLEALGWRVVPTQPEVLGQWALERLPRIEQLLIVRPEGMDDATFDRQLYLARRRTERTIREADAADPLADSYVVSLSSRTATYKGLMVAPQLSRFYPDLLDERTASSSALFHQRYATNTLPNWKIAQPFRYVAHNGEINTLLGNRSWMNARGPALVSDAWGDAVSELHPVIGQVGSDSASFDEAYDLLVSSGRDPLHAMMMLIPEAWEYMADMTPELRGFYEYHACLSEPWDGPAAIAFSDGRVVAAVMDRNGLRPARYQVTRDGVVVMSSEVGLIALDPAEIVESGRLGPGQMVAVDTVNHELLHNDEIKQRVSTRQPYAAWVDGNVSRIERDGALAAGAMHDLGEGELMERQILNGYTKEELEFVVKPMALHGKEPTGSMGDDTPMSAMQDRPRLLYTYFRQKFAQVTNPPIDSIRERVVMALDTYLGRRHSLLEETPQAAQLAHLRTPVLLDAEMRQLQELDRPGFSVATLDARFRVASGTAGLRPALDELCAQADAALDAGHSVLVISDEAVGGEWAPIPMLLAISTVHHHLIRNERRMDASLIASTADARDVHQVACLIGFGASAVHPYLTVQTLWQLWDNDELGDEPFEVVLSRYLEAVDAGVLKIMSKMGISAVASYHGGQIFEALGIADEVIEHSFAGTTSRIGGAGYEEIAADVLKRHETAYPAESLAGGGWYKYRRDGDYHAFEPPVWRSLHEVAQHGGDSNYQAFSELVNEREPTALRDLLQFKSDRAPIPIERVEDVHAITGRFSTGAMSLGALSLEAHEDLARAMNALGGRSNTGEGGEDPRRYLPDGDKHDANSQVKQVASGRFGVTPAYLAGATELEIKIAQGSKPGEGGQLPGHKVSNYIAMLRHSTPGVELISPPPHHDIYSIEDLAQLIYDLKMANGRAKVCVKLVACEGVGTIATGVAKAYADVIHISGSDGGTGASPLSSIKYAGSPWELGLKEAQEALVVNGLRGRVRLRVDGGFRTGRDVVVAALLGGEEFGFGTAALVALGCKMARQCHLNTCPVGVATQREDLRAKYFGKPDMLINFLIHVAQEVRLILAELGYEQIDEIVGHTELLQQVAPRSGERAKAIDLSKLLAQVDGGGDVPLRRSQDRNDRLVDERLDDAILEDIETHVRDGSQVVRRYPVRNIHRAVGARISGKIAQQYGDHGLQPGTIELHFQGSAGQSFGAFLARGLRMYLYGEANDYVGKGMGGGMIAIAPAEGVEFEWKDAVLIGNTVLYGATGGSLFVAGRAGERFGVRNSGARAVVEGLGDHGCEYMTGGTVAVLGPTGRNFAAGMSGGLAYVWDPDHSFADRVNTAMVDLEDLGRRDRSTLHELVATHADYTGSPHAGWMLEAWDEVVEQFVKVIPRDYKRALAERQSETTAFATGQE